MRTRIVKTKKDKFRKSELDVTNLINTVYLVHNIYPESTVQKQL